MVHWAHNFDSNIRMYVLTAKTESDIVPNVLTPQKRCVCLECVSSGTIRKFEWIFCQFKE